MLLILLNYSVIVYVCFMHGVAWRRVVGASGGHPVIALTVIRGMFVVSLITTILLFFTKAGPVMLLAFILTAAAVHLFSARVVHSQLAFFVKTYIGKRELIFGSLLLFTLLVFSAQPSKINDDGYYYIQTMKWFSEAGFVRGISNLMMPLGLSSSWHVLQALFSMDFIQSLRFNDLNGLLVFLFFIFCVEENVFKGENLLLAILMGGTLLISVPFLSAPSPDLPVLILTVVGFFLATTRTDERTYIDLLILAAFAASIKISSVALVLLAITIITYIVVRKVSIPKTVYLVLILCAVSVVAKNVYQTGYPFYPYRWLAAGELKWSTPPEILGYYAVEIKSWGLEQKIYRGPLDEWEDPGLLKTVAMLLDTDGYKRIINVIVLGGFPLLLFTALVDLYTRVRNKSGLFPSVFLHLILVINFFAWLALAPQYRFILPIYVFYGSWIAWFWTKKLLSLKAQGWLHWVPYTSLAGLLFFSIFSVSVDVRAPSREIGKIDSFALRYLLKPHVSYDFDGIDRLDTPSRAYYHMKNNHYCWDGPLPCMSAQYYNFLQYQGLELVPDGEGFVLEKRRKIDGR